jgi:hypothetical protein
VRLIRIIGVLLYIKRRGRCLRYHPRICVEEPSKTTRNLEGRGSCLRYYPRICVEEPSKTTRNLKRRGRCLRYHPCICLEEPSKTTRNLKQRGCCLTYHPPICLEERTKTTRNLSVPASLAPNGSPRASLKDHSVRFLSFEAAAATTFCARSPLHPFLYIQSAWPHYW